MARPPAQQPSSVRRSRNLAGSRGLDLHEQFHTQGLESMGRLGIQWQAGLSGEQPMNGFGNGMIVLCKNFTYVGSASDVMLLDWIGIDPTADQWDINIEVKTVREGNLTVGI